MKDEIEKLIIEKLTQLENNELDDCPSGKLLAQKFSENKHFVEIFNKHKNESKKRICK